MDSIKISIAELLPNGGLVCSMQAGFDDSANGDGSIEVVAGYFLRDAHLAPFRSEWKRLLGKRRFHMVDLVHGKEDFEGMDHSQRDVLARGLIQAIKTHVVLGVAVSVDRAAYDNHINDIEGLARKIGSPHALCSRLCLSLANRWLEKTQEPEEILYFFETGNGKQADNHRFLSAIPGNPSLEQRYQYVQHGFVKKNKLASLDAADLLGWEWTQQCKRLSGVETRPMRASLNSLFETPHITEHLNNQNITLAFVAALLEPYVVHTEGDLDEISIPDGLGV